MSLPTAEAKTSGQSKVIPSAEHKSNHDASIGLDSTAMKHRTGRPFARRRCPYRSICPSASRSCFSSFVPFRLFISATQTVPSSSQARSKTGSPDAGERGVFPAARKAAASASCVRACACKARSTKSGSTENGCRRAVLASGLVSR